MPKKKEIDTTRYVNFTSSSLMEALVAAKGIRDFATAEIIEKEFKRRDLIKVNESIYKKPQEVDDEW